ncbi:hypothetical protein [Ferrovibrio sp.]|uniref:hypothetical protein n=1 Tax=Ferrovibrio sp. TaxID=1917215 RepID=UPI000CAA102B|nr:hypothetical protein [Ferrovibrio sp.]PJI42258.1 MAG: hypothetical protein CTR53_07435 [Ferrovibrio sp.]
MPDQSPPPSLDEVIRNTQELAANRGAQAALAYIEPQYASRGRDPRLLSVMAQLQSAMGNRAAALAIWNQLLPLAPADLHVMNARHQARRAVWLQGQRIEAGFYPTVRDVGVDVKSACAEGDFGYALWTIFDVAFRLVKSLPMSQAAPGNDGTLDALCLEVGRQFAVHAKLAPIVPDTSAPIVYLATAIHEFGGHTRVMIDYIRRQPDRKHVLLLTGLGINMAVPPVQSLLDRELRGIDFTWYRNSQIRHDESLRWLMQQLQNIRPETVYLFGHPYDPVIPAATALLQKTNTYFNHHSDACFSLGAVLPVTAHIDQTPMVHHLLCRHTPQINPVYVPMTAATPARREASAFLPEGAVRTAACGSAAKFTDQSYAYRYADVLPQIMAQTGGEHVHIGALPAEAIAQIHAAMDRQSIPRERFRHIAHVESLAAALCDLKVDLYVASFPTSGGKAVIEAMATGIPVLYHVNYQSRFACVADMVYPEAFRWSDLESLTAALQAADRAALSRHSNLSRAHFDLYYAEQAAAAAFVGGKPVGVPAPPLGDYRPDTTQQMFDRINQAVKERVR